MRNHVRIRNLFTFCILLLVSAICHATVVERLGVAELTHSSNLVLLGQIISLRTVLEGDQIWTIAAVLPEHTIKGRTIAAIEFRIPGGTQRVNGRTLVTKVDGVPDFKIMQKAVFFLNSSSSRYLELTGLYQGFWKVETRNGRQLTASNEEGIVSDSSISLNEFIAQLTRIAQTEKRQ